MNKNENKVAIITGANSGTGEAVATTLTADGFTIVLAARLEVEEKGRALDR